MWWRRHVDGVARPVTADPVLAPPYLARQLFGTTHAAHEPLVSFVEQARRQWQAPRIGKLLACEDERVEVVTDLLYVGVWGDVVAALLCLERQEVDERGLCPLD